MLEYMRQHSRSVLIYAFLSVIILVFVVQFGPQSSGCAPSNRMRAAQVYDHVIEDIDLDMHFFRHVGPSVSPEVELSTILSFRRDLLNDTIDVYLLAAEAERHGFLVDDERLRDYITDRTRNLDYFWFVNEDGSFDPEIYRLRIQNTFRSSIKRYEDYKRREMLARDFMEFLHSQVQVSQGEVEQAYRTANTTVDMAYVEFPWSNYTEQVVEPTEGEVSEWLEDDDNAYNVARRYLDQRQQRWVRPAESDLQMVFLGVGEGESRSAVRNRAEEVRTLIMDGMDFAQAASEYSDDDATAERGGELGWLKEGEQAREFDQAAFAIRAGEVSDVVEMEDGFRIFLSRDYREGEETGLKEVRMDVAREMYKEEQASMMAQVAATQFLALARDSGRDLQAATALHNDEAETPKEIAHTGHFSQSGGDADDAPAGPMVLQSSWDHVPGIGQSAEISRMAFAANESSPLLNQVFTQDGNHYVMSLAERRDADMEGLAQVGDQLRAELMEERATRLLGDWELMLFGPAPQRRTFGRSGPKGIWLARIVDRERHQGRVSINHDLFKMRTEDGQIVDADDFQPFQVQMMD